MSWLKTVGSAIWTAAKDVVHFLGSSTVRNAEAEAANIASLLLPAEAPVIQAFQGLMGRIFQQAVVTETAFANVASAGPQKLAAVVAAIGPELDAWVTNHFPGSATIAADVKSGLVDAIVKLQNSITAPPQAPSA